MFQFVTPNVNETFNLTTNISHTDYVLGQTFFSKYTPVFIINYAGWTDPKTGDLGPTMSIHIE